MKAAVLAMVAALPALMAARDDPLAGRVAGKPQACLPSINQITPEVIDERTILYRFTGKRVWRTGPVGPCRSLRPLTTLIVEVNGGQLCRNDRFRVLTPGTTIPSAWCRFDSFTPYDRVTPK